MSEVGTASGKDLERVLRVVREWKRLIELGPIRFEPESSRIDAIIPLKAILELWATGTTGGSWR